MGNQHIEDSLDKIRTIFAKASARIDAIKPGGKIPATTLADDLAKEIGMTGPQLYPTLKFLFTDYPNVEIRKGAHGGIFKLDPNAPKTAPKTPPAVVASAAATVVPVVVVNDEVATSNDDDSPEAIAAEKEVQEIVNT